MKKDNKKLGKVIEQILEHNKRKVPYLLRAPDENVSKEPSSDVEASNDTPVLENIKAAITRGSTTNDISPVVDELVKQTRILESLADEQVMLRKLSEGSLEYDKQMAQYRNTSGRELKSVVSEKSIPKGGVVDFETARDPLVGQSKAVIERALKQREIERLIKQTTVKETNNTRIEQVPSPVKPDNLFSKDARILDRTFDRFTKKFERTLDKKLSNISIKEEDKTLLENIKEGVGAYKQVGTALINSVVSIGSGIKGAAKAAKGLMADPKSITKSFQQGSPIVEKLKAAKQTVSEVLSVSPEYSVEQERFAKEYAKQKASAPGKKRNKEDIIKEGTDLYKKIVEKEDKISSVEKNIQETKKFGFNPAKSDVAELEKLKAELYSLDPRTSVEKKRTTGTRSVPGKPAPVLQETTGEPANPESDNVVTSQERIADFAKDDLKITAEIRDLNEKQLLELKQIREALAPSIPRELPEQKQTTSTLANLPVSEAVPSAITIPDLLDTPDRKDKPGKNQQPKSGKNKPPSKGPGDKGGSIMKKGAEVFKKAAPVAKTAVKIAAPLSAGFSAYKGVTDLAEGKKVESLGEILPQDFDYLNPLDYFSLPTDVAMRSGMYIGEKINKGYGTVSESLGGSGSLGGDIYEGVQGVKKFFNPDTPKIEAGKGVFAKNLSEFNDKKGEVVQDKQDTFKVNRQEQIAKQLGIDSSKLESKLEGGTVTSINGQDVPTSMLTDYEIESANNARRMRAMLEGVGEDKIKLLKRAEGEVAPTFNATKPQPSTAIAKPPDIPFDATTVAGESGEFVVPAPVEKKEVNAIPAEDLTDPEAAMFESSTQPIPSPISGNKPSEQPVQRLKFEVTARKLKRTGPDSLETPKVEDNSSNLSRKINPVQTSPGVTIDSVTRENIDLERGTKQVPVILPPIISNNVNNMNTTSVVPMKPSPRMDGNSSLDRYLNRVAAY